MDWEEFSDGAICVGGIISTVVCILTTAILSFAWITVPIMLAIFPILATANESALMGLLWVLIFIAHAGAFAFALGLGIRHLPKLARRVLKGIMDDVCSGTD